MMSLWDALRMNMMISYQELVRTFPYDLYIDEKDPGHFIFIEEWPNHAALDEHCASEHFRRLVPLIDQYTRQEARYILMDGVVNPTVTS